MAYNEQTAVRIKKLIEEEGVEVVEKKMFGGLSFLYKKKMSIGIIEDLLMVRVLPEKMKDTLAMNHVTPMDFTKKVMKEFVTVDPKAYHSDEELLHFIHLGIEHAKWKVGDLEI